MSTANVGNDRDGSGKTQVANVRSVLMICPQFAPLVGGYERAAERLSRELVRQSVAVTVITEQRDRRWPADETMAGVQVRRLACWYRPGWHIVTSLLSFALFLLRRGCQYDIWHAHQYGAHATLAVLLGKLLRRPVALKLTSSAASSIDTVLAAMSLSSLHTWAHRRVSACIAVSAETADEAHRFGIPAARIVRISNGIDLEEFHPESPEEKKALRKRHGLDPGPMAVYVGRWSAEKNPLGLIEAWSLLLRRCPDVWPLYMLGDGPLRAEVDAAIGARGLAGRVVAIGSSTQVSDWLRAAELYVLSSHVEGLSNTTMEAMASGLPCVVTAVSGMTELIEKNGAGIVVPCDDPSALADAVERLMTDAPLRQAMGARAREAAMRDYGISAIAKAHRMLYEKVKAERR